MKRALLFAAALALLASCSVKPADPVEEAIISEIMDNMAEGFTSVKIYKVEKIDSTTFGQELERRHHLFEVKKEVDEKAMNKYVAAGKPKNAAIKEESMKKDMMIMQCLDSLAITIEDILDDVAYYDYKFSAQAKSQNSTMEFRDSYAAITPDFEVIGMTAKEKDLHKGLGKVIPGYLEILKGESEEGEE